MALVGVNLVAYVLLVYLSSPFKAELSYILAHHYPILIGLLGADMVIIGLTIQSRK